MDFPEPEGPIIAMNSPSSIRKETSFNTSSFFRKPHKTY
ncbi:hypothetical protein LEP1GSC188_2491 [Leptospira weilii serovar Topaz str. LT2116]|uniref:Uncharacterized protein n=1 Tax=Leptospira weilii serovar Topaz str. LT2116 TaxID=1088540 RepID=M3GUP0_9LEPT|nr:hypothetical protein LEP1GSC188_2491 [Leptospira weilii serovar Topaz str. LT2116]